MVAAGDRRSLAQGYWMDMMEGKVEGLFVMGRTPLWPPRMRAWSGARWPS